MHAVCLWYQFAWHVCKPHKWTFNVPYHVTGHSIGNGTLLSILACGQEVLVDDVGSDSWKDSLLRSTRALYVFCLCTFGPSYNALIVYAWASSWCWILIQMSLFLYRHHGILSRDETARRLGNVDGRYLVRSSSSQPGTDILSFMWGHSHIARILPSCIAAVYYSVRFVASCSLSGQVRHFVINTVNGEFHIGGCSARACQTDWLKLSKKYVIAIAM